MEYFVHQFDGPSPVQLMNVVHDRRLLLSTCLSLLIAGVVRRLSQVTGVKRKVEVNRLIAAQYGTITAIFPVISQLGIYLLKAHRGRSPSDDSLELIPRLAVVLYGYDEKPGVGCPMNRFESPLDLEAGLAVSFGKKQRITKETQRDPEIGRDSGT
jgi:hypothetical protein